MDSVTRTQHSRNMSPVRSRGNKTTELALAAAFRTIGLTGWRRHFAIRLNKLRRSRTYADARMRDIVRPDLVFHHHRLAVFVDGCFWHQCPKHGTLPKTRRRFLQKKLAVNRARDRKTNRILRKNRWTAVRVWEHGVAKDAQARADRPSRIVATRSCLHACCRDRT